MGFFCPEQQSTPDFLTSLTSSEERTPREGFEGKVPQTAEQFAARWQESPQRKQLLQEIATFNQKYPIGGPSAAEFAASRKLQQAKNAYVVLLASGSEDANALCSRAKSPYTLSYAQQVKLCLWRGFLRLKADPSLTLTQLIGGSASYWSEIC